jgi:hypothetical protein
LSVKYTGNIMLVHQGDAQWCRRGAAVCRHVLGCRLAEHHVATLASRQSSRQEGQLFYRGKNALRQQLDAHFCRRRSQESLLYVKNAAQAN